MGVGGGGLRVHVYLVKLKGLEVGGGLGFCYVIIFCKAMAVRHISRHLSFF